MEILIKFPTRGRPDNFFRALDLYYQMAEDLTHIRVQVTIDDDDPEMNTPAVKQRLAGYPRLMVNGGNSRNKIHAINRDLVTFGWDILLLASDDMIPVVKGYDNIIRQKMAQHYPDTDGVLWFNDGNRSDLNTLSIMGHAFYKRFGYIYYPGYRYMYCDKEFTLVAGMLGKQTYFGEVIIQHEHPDYGYGNLDEVHELNNLHKNSDLFLFLRREARQFDIGNTLQNRLQEMAFVLRHFVHRFKRKYVI